MAKQKSRKHAESFEAIVLSRFDSLESKMDAIRTEVVPGLNQRMGNLETKVEERTGRKATIISVVSALVASAAAFASAKFR